MNEPFTLVSLLNEIGVFIAIPILVILAWNLWNQYINALYLKSIPWIILEITPPREVFKSPLAMELVLNTLHGGGAGNWYEKYWKGELAQYYSLEIVSIEGKVRFFVRFHKKFRRAFESQLYAQYPEAEIKEVADYTTTVPSFKKDGPIGLFAYDLALAKDDPYPIKSYVDYGLDKAIGSLEEEQRIDPITPLLETMGSIGIGEQIWVQINIRQDTKRYSVKKGDKVEENKSWKDKAREVIKEMNDKLKEKEKNAEGKETTTTRRATRGEQNVVEAIERHMNKPGFDTGIRVLYIAEKEYFNKKDTISAFTAMWRQFATEDLNSFKLTNLTKPSEPWKDIFGTKLLKMKKDFLDDYKDRSFFYGGFKFSKLKTYFSHPAVSGNKPFLLSTEELATIFHLPGRVASTPTVERIEAKKAEPPADLPI